MAGIYFHIPYCKKACTYCDFHFSTTLGNRKEMVLAMRRELALRKDYLDRKPLQSLYFGGGTPSVLDSDDIIRLVDDANQNFRVDPGAEVTVEVNPDDVTPQLIKAYLSGGVNRLSIGLQSFNKAELAWMNRAHDDQQGLASVKMAQDGGITNLSIDLIYGSRFQNEDTWMHTLQTANALGVTHISSYNLTIEKGTVLGHRQAKGLEPEVNDEFSSKQFLTMSDFLESEGFLHYEISNFGKPGFVAVHNSNYWKQHHYLGIGPSAHSFDGISRQWNIRNNPRYIDALMKGEPFFEREVLTTSERYNEYVMTRLRTMWGCDTVEIENRFGERYLRHFLDTAKTQVAYLDRRGTEYTLNREGKLLADGIASAFFFG